MKQAISLNLNQELVERLRNAVYWSPGLTMREVMENGIEDEVSKIEALNGGKFKRRDGEVAFGRRVKKYDYED